MRRGASLLDVRVRQGVPQVPSRARGEPIERLYVVRRDPVRVTADAAVGRDLA